jgi:hypothetical protein
VLDVVPVGLLVPVAMLTPATQTLHDGTYSCDVVCLFPVLVDVKCTTGALWLPKLLEC